MIRRTRRKKKRLTPEELLVKRVANFIKTNYPKQPFRFDQIDQIGLVAGKKNKEIHGAKFSKGYPDLFIAHCKRNKKGKMKFGGLYVELKATKTVHNTEHTRTQSAYHAVLRYQGYKVYFACGFDESVAIIKDYLQ